jgi:hypothetical protein
MVINGFVVVKGVLTIHFNTRYEWCLIWFNVSFDYAFVLFLLKVCTFCPIGLQVLFDNMSHLITPMSILTKRVHF